MTGTKTSPEGQERNNLIWIGKTQTDPYWERCARHFDIVSYENVYDAVADILIHGPIRACVINAIAFGSELRTLIQTILSKELTRSIFIYNPIIAPGRDDFSFAGDLRVREIKNIAELAELLGQISDEGKAPVKTDQIAEIETKVDQPTHQPQTSPSEAPASPGESLGQKIPDVSPEEKKSPPMPWPMEPPAAERSFIAESVPFKDVEIAHDQSPEVNSKIQEKNEDEVESGELQDALNLDKLSSKKSQEILSLDSEDVEISEGDFHLAQLTSEELDALLGFEPDKKMKEHK